MAEIEPEKLPPGVWDAWWIYTSPSALFDRIEDTGAYGLTLVTLLAFVTLIGYLQVQSGLIDRLVEQQTNAQLEKLETSRQDLVDRTQLSEVMKDVRKQGEFNKTMRRLQVIVFSPIRMLAAFLLTSSLLYAAVALTGRKPEYHTLMSICVYAGFIDLVAYGLRAAMMFYYRTIAVDTSMGMFVNPHKPTVLVALDPFVIWYWILVAIGLTVTRQLSRRMAIVCCTGLCLCTMSLRIAGSYAAS